MSDFQREDSRKPLGRNAHERRETSPGSVYARALLTEIDAGRGGVRKIASALRLDIREVEADGFEGALIRAKGLPVGAIAVSQSIREPGRKNFTIAHEIGHFVLPGHQEISLACTASDVANWGDSSRQLEREADEFAAELLMPASLVESIITGASPSLSIIEKIAREAGASLSAAAWRYCDLAIEKCAVIWSTDGVIQWAKRSAGFPFFLPKGQPVKEGTFAAACFTGNKVPSRPWGVAAHLWIEAAGLHEEAAIWEQSRALPAYRSVLSLLWIRRPLQEEGGSRVETSNVSASRNVGRQSSPGNEFPTTIKVKVAALNYGPHTRTFGRVFSFIFDGRRQYTLQIGRGNRSVEYGVFVFHLPPDFGNLSRLEQAKVLIRESKQAKKEEGSSEELDFLNNFDFFYDLDEDSIKETDIHCVENLW